MVYRSRAELLERHPLTVLEGHEPPRLSARVRRLLLLALHATVGAAVVAVGAVLAPVLARSGQGALLGLTALSVCLLAALGGLVRSSLGALTVEVVGMGWMLSSMSGSAAAVWGSRAPLLVAALGGALAWLDLAAPGRPVPRRLPRSPAASRLSPPGGSRLCVDG